MHAKIRLSQVTGWGIPPGLRKVGADVAYGWVRVGLLGVIVERERTMGGSKVCYSAHIDGAERASFDPENYFPVLGEQLHNVEFLEDRV